MATHQIPILGWSTVPDNSGNVFIEPFTVKAVNDKWGHLVTVFNDTSTRIGLRGSFVVPQNYVGTARIIPMWTANATSGNVIWDFDYRAVGLYDAESLDQASIQQSVAGSDSAPSAAFERKYATLAPASSNFSPGDIVQFELFRDGADVGDTMAAAALLFALLFEYSDV